MTAQPDGKKKSNRLHVGEEVRKQMLNARNKEAKLKARTRTGPLVWCRSKDAHKCDRCGPRAKHYGAGLVRRDEKGMRVAVGE